MSNFSVLLDEFRKTRAVSKKQLAQISNLTPGYISLLTRGERTAPSFETVAALAGALVLDEEQRSRFFEAAGYSSLFSSGTSDLFSESVASHMHDAGRIGDALEELRSAIPRQLVFYGREKELEQLRHLILEEPTVQCLAIVGIGGVGKTSITIELVERIKSEFEYVHWYPFQTLAEETFSNIMTDCMRYFSEEPAKDAESDTNSKLEFFITCLEKRRCLLILDNFESLLKSGSLVGEYADGYRECGKLLNLVCSRLHRSCLILTSREKPDEVARQEGMVVKS